MRTVTFSDEELQEKLPEQFVLAWQNTEGVEGSGNSYKTKPGQDLPYQPRMASGYNNSQVFLLAPDGTVLNAYPGYWSPMYLKKMLQANWLFYRNVWTSDRYTERQKKKILKAFYRSEAKLLEEYKMGVPAELRSILAGPNAHRSNDSLLSVTKVTGGGWSGNDSMRNRKKAVKLKRRLTKNAYFLTSWSRFDVTEFVGRPSGFSKFYGIEPETADSGEEEFSQTHYNRSEMKQEKTHEKFESEK